MPKIMPLTTDSLRCLANESRPVCQLGGFCRNPQSRNPPLHWYLSIIGAAVGFGNNPPLTSLKEWQRKEAPCDWARWG